MAAPRSMQSGCCQCLRRLRVSCAMDGASSGQSPVLTTAMEQQTSRRPEQLVAQSRSLHVSSISAAPASDNDSASTSRSKTPSKASTSSDKRRVESPLLALRQSVDEPLDKHNTPQLQIERALLALAKERDVPLPPQLQPAEEVRLPRAVQALYLTPLRRTPTHGIPVANLQLRSYSVRNLEFMADFALRAAYYLDLPAKGPVPLPRITERWTIPRDVFIFKKSQENWERVTMRRLIQIQDGHPDVVQRWLAFVRKWCWYGVGMKANVWEHEDMDVIQRMDAPTEDVLRAGLEGTDWDLIGRRRGLGSAEELSKLMSNQGFGPMGASSSGVSSGASSSKSDASKKAAGGADTLKSASPVAA